MAAAGLVGVAVNGGVGDGGAGVGVKVGPLVEVAGGVGTLVRVALGDGVGVVTVEGDVRGVRVVAGLVRGVGVAGLTVGDGVTIGVGKRTTRTLQPVAPGNRITAMIMARTPAASGDRTVFNGGNPLS